MQYVLMHRNHEAALLDISSSQDMDRIRLLEVINLRRLPFSVQYAKGSAQEEELNKWATYRIIPENRYGVDKLLSIIGKDRFRNSLISHGLSLSDVYWYKRPNEHLTWEEVNFFQNRFSYDIGNFVFGIGKDSPNLESPDLTTNGLLKKTWRIKDQKSHLIKLGRPPYFAEPYNEKAVSMILDEICDLDFVKYDTVKINNVVCSICENFLQEGTEFIPADEVFRTKVRPDFVSTTIHLKDCCKSLGIPGYEAFIDGIQIIDYLVNNTDRHLGNFGFIRDVETLEFIGPAPIFDNGSAFWNDTVKTPEETYAAAVALFQRLKRKNTDKVNLSDGRGIREIVRKVFMHSRLPKERIEREASLIHQRFEVALEMIEKDHHHEKEEKHTEYEMSLR